MPNTLPEPGTPEWDAAVQEQARRGVFDREVDEAIRAMLYSGTGGEGFKLMAPSEWAKPVDPTEFLIRGALCRDTFGVNGGPKKSLKTHENCALLIAVAYGLPLYGHSTFEVPKAQSSLYIIGEGGEKPMRRTLLRMGKAYGLTADEILIDPRAPLHIAFGSAPANSPAFRDEIKRLLDTVQPEGLVALESFYNFHPNEVQAGNLYERGGAIDQVHRLFKAERAPGLVSLITDHFRANGTSGKLDLDDISMAGQAENADSWILRKVTDKDVQRGEFELSVKYGSRQWGETNWKVRWHLGEFDHEAGEHTGDISWDVTAAEGAEAARAKQGRGDGNPVRRVPAEFRMGHMLGYIKANPHMLKTEHLTALAFATDVAQKTWSGLHATALAEGLIEKTKIERDENGRTVKRSAFKVTVTGAQKAISDDREEGGKCG